jgi:hypothetical protein
MPWKPLPIRPVPEAVVALSESLAPTVVPTCPERETN